MTLWALGLALFGAVCWGVAPIFGKLGLQHTDPATGLAARTLVAASLMGAWTLASGRMAEVQQIPPRAWVMIAIEGLLGTVIGDLAYYASLKWGEAGEVSLVMAASPLVTLLFASVAVQEAITWTKLLGAALVVCGLLLLGWQERTKESAACARTGRLGPKHAGRCGRSVRGKP